MNHEISGTQFGIFKRSALPEQICDRFLSLIEEGQIRPGQKLPPERELAAVMGVSRPCLREALRALALMNVLEMRQGDGTYVTSLEPSLLIEHLDFVFSLDDSLFLQLFQARKVLEPGIAAIAAREISEDEIADLWACLDKALKNIENREVFLQTDLELHTAIAVAARNPILSRFMQVLSRLGAASRRRTVELPGIRKQSLADHRAIVTALDARDPEAARRAMLLHLENVERRLEAMSAQSGQSSTAASQQ